MKRLVALGFLVLFIIGAGLFVWYTWPKDENLHVEIEPVEEVPTQTTRTYTSLGLGYSLTYPFAFMQSEHTYDFSETKDIEGGFRVTISPETATGTNLGPDTYIAVEQLPNANNCTGDIYLRANVTASEVRDGSVTYSVASSTEETENGSIEEWVWALTESSPCTAIRYYISSTAADAETVGFNRAALLREFEGIRRSLRAVQTEESAELSVPEGE